MINVVSLAIFTFILATGQVLLERVGPFERDSNAKRSLSRLLGNDAVS